MPTHTILQISDLHLLPHAGETMLGIDTEYYFHRVLDHAFAANPKIELILVTGDLTQDPYLDCYQRIEQKLQTYGIRCICLPGNHDDDALMQSALNVGRVSCNKQTFIGDWQIIALNSRIPGKPGGRLAKQELDFLEDCLRAYPDRHALIAVHHPCLTIASPWLDAMMIENSNEFLAVLHRYPKVEAVTCGHIHQVVDKQVESLRIFSAPSTCFQFEPKSLEFSVVDTAPGYRMIRLQRDGGLETAVYRLPEALSGLRPKADPY
ncbi:3',5'-cyclic-AMP phosphodiesterase [Methylomicrobium sp. Wu6]|uniref:3',5'-cyclic-AMP phosphodiesterase n=1 Tax=Methylomicrobium sp. Wu6 TaxID=3107928 RepID=UPI002DD6B2DE|nr:3',5'-cyclic-AMP phosphodiesterase [Methylomicrobium sp. Wu6]MEC4750588.1 3',5'-cyclic-AMP phosphodiesterase [Methylomicrobium sp. Wu6]